MAPSAVMFMLSHSLIQQITTNTTLQKQPQREPPSPPAVKCLLLAKNSSEISYRPKFIIWRSCYVQQEIPRRY
ncbi:hypothetical protein EUTSA_v10027095mg [Eutrema salsugineum]|uniref:Uncharacterized protein n=1 Tax=Eutrema salsugineum TaxID=72664 RepID=V4LT39_EUTSA|nr:hypothetical protein EUTSA_v10027095mg [Eutrema salsugineum]